MSIDLLFPHNGKGKWASISIPHAKRVYANVHDMDGCDNYSSPSWDVIVASYPDYSTNPLSFELLCVKRYLYCQSYAKAHGIQRFMMLDTDVLVYPGLDCHLSSLISGSEVGLSQGPEGAGVAPHFSPHCSYWTLDSLTAFVDWLPDYIAGQERLKGRYGAKGTFPLQLSDMTLLADWIEQTGHAVCDLSVPHNGRCIDHNIMIAQQGGTRFRNTGGVKMLDLKDGQPLSRIASGDHIQMLALHFQGKAKGAMSNFSRGKFGAAQGYLLGIKAARKIKRLF